LSAHVGQRSVGMGARSGGFLGDGGVDNAECLLGLALLAFVQRLFERSRPQTDVHVVPAFASIADCDFD